MYCLVSEIYIGRRLLEDCFYCYSQQIISTADKESLIPYNLTLETQNFYCCNTKRHRKPNRANIKYGSDF